MKRLRKRIIPWTLAVLMALTCGASAAFAGEDVQPVEGEAVGDTVSVEAEQPGVSPEDENTEVATGEENSEINPEDGNSVNGEKQTEDNDAARLGEESKETNSTVYVDYVGYAERLTDNIDVCPGETAGFTTRMYRYESSPEKDVTSTRIYDYTVDWNIVQIDNVTGDKIQQYTISRFDNGKSIDITVNKTSPVSYFEIHPTFHMGDKTIDPGLTLKLYVNKEIISGKIINNYGFVEPSLPGDSADYYFEVSWKKFDAKTGKVIEMDTSNVETTWEVVLPDEKDEDASKYVSYKVDANNPNLLHFKINEGWVDEDKDVEIRAKATVGDEEPSDFRRLHLKKEVAKFETDECRAEAGSVISIEKLNPKAKLYDEANPDGIYDDEYSFRFLDVYYMEIIDGSVPLKDVTVSPDGKTLTVPKVKEGRYIVCINADNGITLPTQFYAPIYVVNKDAAETTDDAAAGTTDSNDNASKSDKDSAKSDKDSAKTGDDTNLALWLVLMLFAGAGTAGTAVYTRRKRTTE